MESAKTALNILNEDRRRLALAEGFAHFVLEILKDLPMICERREVFYALRDAAYDAEMQWMAKEQFRLMQELEKQLLARLELQPLPTVIINANPSQPPK